MIAPKLGSHVTFAGWSKTSYNSIRRQQRTATTPHARVQSSAVSRTD